MRLDVRQRNEAVDQTDLYTVSRIGDVYAYSESSVSKVQTRRILLQVYFSENNGFNKTAGY
jgi:hypothetical protein